MRKNILIIACVLFPVVHGEKIPFIFGGEPVTDNIYSFMVYIQYYFNETHYRICSGSIIREKWVLTAAHCFEKFPNPDRVILIVGEPEVSPDEDSNGLLIDSAKMIYIHEKFDFLDKKKLDNDIALIELATPIIVNENVSIIDYSREKSRFNLNCIVLGFGATEKGSKGLLYRITNSVILPPEKCETAANHHLLNGHFVCLFNKTRGICDGDSGGPLLCNQQLYALSTGSNSKLMRNKDCISVTESYFLMIEPYKEWMQDIISPKPISDSKLITVIVTTVFVCLALFTFILFSLYYIFFKRSSHTNLKENFMSNRYFNAPNDDDENV